MKIIMNKKPGRVLLICIIILAIICPLHIYHDKKKVEDIKSGAIVIQNSETPIDELHPEFAYLWLLPYGIAEVVLLSLYYVRTRDWLTAIEKVGKQVMKKIIMVLVIFISSIIFYDSYVNLSQKQYNDVINLSYKFAQENDMEVVPIDLQLSEDKQERTEQFNQVYSFLQEHSYPCFVGIVSKNIKTKYVSLSNIFANSLIEMTRQQSI